MMDFVQKIQSLTDYQAILGSIQSGNPLSGLALPRAARLPVLAALYQDLRQPLLLIVDRADHAIAIRDELAFWVPGAPIFLFSEPTPLFYEEASWGSNTRIERLQAMTTLSRYHLPSAEKPSLAPILVASARALMIKTMPRRDYLKQLFHLQTGNSYQIDSLFRSCISMGYEPVEIILERGMICRRGGLLDIWPPNEENPLRMDFFGNELETIRYFDSVTQRTIKKLGGVLITPAREYIIPNNGVQEPARNNSEFHIPLLHPFPSSILDYLPQDAVVIIEDLKLLESAINEFEEQAVVLRSDLEADGALEKEFPVPYFTKSELFDSIQTRALIEFGYPEEQNINSSTPAPNSLASKFLPCERFGGRLKPFLEHLVQIGRNTELVYVVSRQSARLKELWFEEMDRAERTTVEFIEASLSAGCRLENQVLFTDSEIFGWERPQARTRQRLTPEIPEMAYADLSPGDWIVHVDYGIGRFSGLVHRSLDGLEREYLRVEFHNNDQVFVPIHQADRLTRYIGPGGTPPSAGHVGTQEWGNTKRQVQEAVRVVARDLLELYARRQVSKGHAFKSDTDWQGELESSFPYVETADQVRALMEIKRDMESDRPMDRLLCGDVGYGKTEVALRSAFKAVMDGKQVAVLVPTTVLAQQHFDTFQQRLSTYPVTVEMLSRFRTQREQTAILNSLVNGAVDIIIGTHRLLSMDVQFSDLGLLIIDEEQRFGVTHKERLKQLRADVDVLTLTATPIPRTLYMALTGVRDISNLNTPPEERLPIVTHIGPYSPRLVRQAIIREIERGGQVFFVHNRVQTIHAMKMHLEKLVPGARISIGHGQMPEKELEFVMHRFTSGDVDILLSTSIIESGLDIPNANTLIVDRGDAFGLAQLYQLRGRVGRGATRAYAYFFRHRKLAPSPEGQERLEVIAENTQLGAGYSIAMRDLEMRGAGELLGTRQSGYIASVGFHLYTRLLADAVRKLRIDGALLKSIPRILRDQETIRPAVTVDLPISVCIPETYVSDQALRLRLYRRLADISDEPGLDALTEEFADRFGPPPEELLNLIYQLRIKLLAEKAGLVAIGFESGQLVLRYPSPSTLDKPVRLPDLKPGVRSGKNAYWFKIDQNDSWQVELMDVIKTLINRQPH